jgi:hypothetical protein
MEERSNSLYITNRLFPQDRGEMPVFSASGKYHYCMYVNGVNRCVALDDRVLAMRNDESKFVCGDCFIWVLPL